MVLSLGLVVTHHLGWEFAYRPVTAFLNDVDFSAMLMDGMLSLLLFAGALSKDWENPSSVENVITMSADPAIYGAQMGILANPNLVYSEYAGVAEELEKKVVRQIALLAGYDPARATGIFTQGGTFCNLYGYLLGIRKSLPQAKHKGLGHYQDYPKAP
jgi:glutamate/tyrosine decarboxylase-like PLP-dependent enzyme